EQLRSLFAQLHGALGKSGEAEVKDFLSELLGSEEQIMLAKRLAAIVLITEGYSFYKVSRLLKISSATADKIGFKLKRGDYDHILRVVGKSRKSYFDFLNTLDSILH